MIKLYYQILLYDKLTLYKFIEGEQIVLSSEVEDIKREIKNKYPDGVYHFLEGAA